ncbi:MAG TPA: tRNA (adenosine(37)-N6)-threonylcarbamoyltransferase complex dimerization subunit type 1 TsaB [Allosphingosinicella sp.]|jgi:tRNA threonylcarbamoyl adenosine modification protein YeaZ
MILAIETTTVACSVALIEGDDLVDERHEIVGRGHAERLLPLIEDLLRGRRPDSILVDVGPGSFTGLRVGLAAAQGLRIGWGVPLRGFSAMALLALQAEDRAAAVALAGGHGQLFVQSFGHDPLTPLDPLRSLPPEEAARVIRAPLVLGSGAAALVAARGFGEAVDALPRAADARFLPEALADLPPRPIYGRPPDANPQEAKPAR